MPLPDNIYTADFFNAILYALRQDGRKTEFRIQEIQDILLSEKKLDRSKYQIRNALEVLQERKRVVRIGPNESTRYALATGR